MSGGDGAARSAADADADAGLPAVAALAGAIRSAVGRVVVGRDAAVDQLIVALLAGGHALVEDLPGTGKTTLCKALAAALDLRFGRIQLTPDLLPPDVLGVHVFDPDRRAFEFREGPIFANIVLADEINRATPRTQSALLEAMQEQQVSLDGVTMALPLPFLVVATLNPFEMEGTFPLPEAQLDRFLLRISLGYPTHDEEAALLDRYRADAAAPCIDAVAGVDDVLAARRAVAGVRVAAPARDYVLALIAATRADTRLSLGASPRAALALQRAAQAVAALDARDYVVADDIKSIAEALLSHRIVASSASSLRGIDARRVVRDLLESVAVPLDG